MTTKEEILSWPRVEVTFLVEYSYYQIEQTEKRSETLLLPPPLDWLGIRKAAHYENFTSAIENADDYARKVLIDLYRESALGNFTVIYPPDAPRGKRLGSDQSKAWAQRLYPNQGTLSGFVNNLTTATTLCGLFIYNLLLKHKPESEADYRMLGAVLHTFREMDACPTRSETASVKKRVSPGQEQSPYLIELNNRQRRTLEAAR